MGVREIKNHIEEFSLNQGENALQLVRDLGLSNNDDTLRRIKASWEGLLSGYNEIDFDFMRTFDNVSYNQMIIVKDIEFYSLCEHHFLPFFGKIHFAYIPNCKIVGLSKIPRLVDVYSKRLQLQERLAEQVVDGFMEIVSPQGCAVMVEGTHLCMKMRGVEKQHAFMITTALRGCFQQSDIKAEFISAIRNGGSKC